MRLVLLGAVLSLLGCYPLDSTWDPYSPNYIPPGRLVFQPASGLDFGSIEQLTPFVQELTFINDGKRDLLIESLDIAGVGFSLGAVTLPQILAPAQELTVDVAIDSNTIGTYNADLVVQTSRGTYRTGLRGTVAPPGSLSPDLVFIQGKNDRYVTYLDNYTFTFGGDRFADFNSWQVPFRVYNRGNMTATQVSLTLNGSDFVAYGLFTNITILSGQTSPEFRIQFPAGSTPGYVTGSLHLNSSNHSSIVLILTAHVQPSYPILNIVDRNDCQYFVDGSNPVILPLTFRDHLLVNTGQGVIRIDNLIGIQGRIEVNFSGPVYLNTGQYQIIQLRKVPSASAGPEALEVHTDSGTLSFAFEAP